ncbi:cytochrome P450 [Hypoxylon rubiginosum]|uniref:Cytochrome P450 n=1 Tax=Hypoxylon rubiginosum TaxID=110542 RepID=A0ACB9Z3J4_9PEZI|nr:cytochrome P450 [Hypoxylon rubiginosum]
MSFVEKVSNDGAKAFLAFIKVGHGQNQLGNPLRVLTLYHIYSSFEVLRRLRTELAAAARQKSAGSDLCLSELEQLPYLTAVLIEGLRLSPAIATRDARAAPDRDLHYEGWRIPVGTQVGMTTILVHHYPDLYPDQARFNPEKWMGMDVRKKSEKTCAPFSRGRRICMGM